MKRIPILMDFEPEKSFHAPTKDAIVRDVREKILSAANATKEEKKSLLFFYEKLVENPLLTQFLQEKKFAFCEPFAFKPEEREPGIFFAMDEAIKLITNTLLYRSHECGTIGIFPNKYLNEWKMTARNESHNMSGLSFPNRKLEDRGFNTIIKSLFLYGDRESDEGDYSDFFNRLKPGGRLIASEWSLLSGEKKHSSQEEEFFFTKILEWQACKLHSREVIIERLLEAGFIDICYITLPSGKLSVFIAKKPNVSEKNFKTKRLASHAPRRSSSCKQRVFFCLP